MAQWSTCPCAPGGFELDAQGTDKWVLRAAAPREAPQAVDTGEASWRRWHLSSEGHRVSWGKNRKKGAPAAETMCAGTQEVKQALLGIERNEEVGRGGGRRGGRGLDDF